MKKALKMFLYLFLALFGLLFVMIISLNIYYSVLESRLERSESTVQSAAADMAFQDKSDKTGEEAKLNLIPVPKIVKFTGGYYTVPDKITFSVADSIKEEAARFLEILSFSGRYFTAVGGEMIFIQNEKLPVQGYILKIAPRRVTIEYSNRLGMWYALVSLKVLNQNYSGTIPCVTIEDNPDLEVRGLMLDISRDKVPTRESLIGVAQLLSDLKYNHLELYIEGFSFAYPSFQNLWEGKETPLTGEDIEALDTFCRDHFIDLVPNQNSLGHMMQWLATDEYKDLAECPKGYKIFGLLNMKGTIDPNDPGSIELVTKMTDDLLPHFSSLNFNVNLDEPFELGKGKNRKIAEKEGVGRVYLDYVLKMHKLSADRGRKMLMWGDIVLKHPDLIPLIPRDITLLDWGYESGYPFEKNSKTLQAAGLNYMVCPGTNSWTTITGRTDNMLATIGSAAKSGAHNGAKGLLLTDWGDMGHWQYLPVSYAGYTVGAAYSWNSNSENELPLGRFLSSYLFRDDKGIMGNLVLDLGRYSRFEEFPMLNMTTTMMAFQFGLRDKVMINEIFHKMIAGISELMGEIAPEMVKGFVGQYQNRHKFDYQGLDVFLSSKEELLMRTAIGTSDSTLIKDEYKNAILLIRIGSGLKEYIDKRGSLSISDQKAQLVELREQGRKYLEVNRRLWLSRNKPGGYDRSTAVLNELMNQIDKRILMLERSAPAQRYNRLLERAGTAGAAIYIGSV